VPQPVVTTQRCSAGPSGTYDTGSYGTAIAVAEVAEFVRGYEGVKLARVERYRARRSQVAGGSPPRWGSGATPGLTRHPGPGPPEPSLSRQAQTCGRARRVLDRLTDTPAQVVTDLGVTLVQNRLAVALLGDQTSHDGPARSAYFRWFLGDPAERALRAEREHAAQSRLWAADLRAATGRGTPGADALVTQLLAGSPEFTEIWARHEVAAHSEQRKTLVHPDLGEVELDCQVLYSDDRGQRLLVFTATPGTIHADRLELLSVVGRQFTG